VTLLETTFDTLLGVTLPDWTEEAEDILVPDLTLVVRDEDVVVEDLMLVTSEEDGFVDVLTLLSSEELFELELTGVDVPAAVVVFALAQTNCVWPISQAPLMLKDSNTMLSMAFKFAPANELNATVYVWVDPVTPVKVV
jgi:hypothetical protein